MGRDRFVRHVAKKYGRENIYNGKSGGDREMEYWMKEKGSGRDYKRRGRKWKKRRR